MTYNEQYRKSYTTAVSTNFKEFEFLCTCRGRFCSGLYGHGIDPKLIVLLETIRSLAGDKPVTILSGYRCRKRNLLPKNKGGVDGATSSQHMLATAADIIISGCSPFKVRRKARKAFRKLRRINPSFKGLGFGLGKYSTFTHVDTRRNRARW